MKSEPVFETFLREKLEVIVFNNQKMLHELHRRCEENSTCWHRLHAEWDLCVRLLDFFPKNKKYNEKH